MTKILPEEEIVQIVFDPIITGVTIAIVSAAIIGGVGFLIRSKRNTLSKNTAKNLVKDELQSYSNFLDKIKNELHPQWDSIIEIKTPELAKQAEKMLDINTKCFTIHYFNKLSIEDKSKFFQSR